MPVKPPIDAEDALTKRRCKKWDDRVYHVYFNIPSDSEDTDTDVDDKPPTVNSTQAPCRKPPKKKKKSINWQLVKENEKLMKKEFKQLDEMASFLLFQDEGKTRLKIFILFLEELFFLTEGKNHDILDYIDVLQSQLNTDDMEMVETGDLYCDLNVDWFSFIISFDESNDKVSILSDLIEWIDVVSF